MKILYCNKYNFAFSGTETYLFELMDLMRARGHEAALFAMADRRGRPTRYDQHFLPLADFKSNGHGLMDRAVLAARAIYSWEARRRLRRMMAEFQPDVAHVRNIYHHLSPAILWELKAQGVPVVYHVNDFKLICPSYNLVSKGTICERCLHGQFWHVVTEGCYAGPPGSSLVLAAEAYFHKWLRTYERCVDVFLAPSQFVKDKLVENGWQREKIEVLSHFQNLPPKAVRIQEDAPILYFGRLSAEKGVDDLLRAMQRLPEIRLQVAGDGPQRRELEGLARSLRLNNVSFLGHMGKAELERQISASRFTVFPSRAYETLGKSILEAYACGRAVVASDLGSRRELLQHGKTGLLFPPGDVNQLASAADFLARRPAQAAAMGAAGRDLVERQHSPQAHYVALMRLYERLRRNKPRPQSTLPKAPKVHVAFIGGRGVVSKYSGIETYYEEAGKRLVAMGHDVTVYCRKHFTPPIEQYEGMKVVRLPTLRSKHLETAVHTLLSTIHALFQDYDILHYHTLGPALLSFLPRWFGKRTVVTVQGLDWQRKKWGPLAARVLRMGEKAAVKFPNATMVVSRTLQQYYRTQYGAETLYVPNGARIGEWRQPSQLARWKIVPGQYILFAGRLSPEKNCHLLIQAYERISTPVKLVLAGGSPLKDPYGRELRMRESERVIFAGWVAGRELEDLVANAVLFVLPSDLEGLSLALLDAMGAGVCVLASDIPENREVVEGVGFTFRPGDVDDLERVLQRLISNPELRRRAARLGRERVRERYLWPDIACQIDRIYCELLAPKPRTLAEKSLPEKQPPDSATRAA
jgi:glycosyltransferase involved in cell wall biosynthesis